MDDDGARILAHLADPTRRRVIAALALGATTLEEIKKSTGLTTRDVATALGRLISAGLVLLADDRHSLAEETFRQAAVAARTRRPQEHNDAPAATARVLTAFLREGRLVSIPAQRAKRLLVLDVLAQEFEPGRHYEERTVNTILSRWHEDTAALRRSLVDEGFLDRKAGEYWRAGGTVDV